MKQNITYVISLVSHSKLFEWTASMLDREKYNLSFILLHKEETPFEKHLLTQGFSVSRIHYESKIDLIKCVFQIRKLLKKEKTQILHTHLFEAGLVGMLAGKLAGVKQRIHTRHDAMIHHDSHPNAVKYDRLTNHCATRIIAITENVKNILMSLENVNESKITVIHHGFLLSDYSNVPAERIENAIKKYYPTGKPFPVIGVVSRFIEWKGIQFVIEAFAKLLKAYPNAHLLLANAQGPFQEELVRLLAQLPTATFSRIVFEKDVAALYKTMDIFVHVPVDAQVEAFGQVYIEAMAAGVPMIVTQSGIASDCIIDKANALVVRYRNSEDIYKSLIQLIESETLRNELALAATKMVEAEFGIDKMIQELEKLYDA